MFLFASAPFLLFAICEAFLRSRFEIGSELRGVHDHSKLFSHAFRVFAVDLLTRDIIIVDSEPRAARILSGFRSTLELDEIGMLFGRPSIYLLTFAAAFLIPATFARTSYDYGIDRTTLLKRQAPKLYATTGIHTGVGSNSSLPIRHEIRKLEQDNTTWTLYVLGLDMLQYTNQSETLSWYQIAGS